MKFKRIVGGVFTLDRIMKQLIIYLQEKKRLPKTIYLPPEEYIIINYLFDLRDMPNRQITKFIGIPLKVDYSKQDTEFTGV